MSKFIIKNFYDYYDIYNAQDAKGKYKVAGMGCFPVIEREKILVFSPEDVRMELKEYKFK